ncbi:MAG: hypothetical protein K0U98_10685 [Deltaproteobacteria bacterium]|nr:hypothetical protein [Deltaproteobacteria bacterium]
MKPRSEATTRGFSGTRKRHRLRNLTGLPAVVLYHQEARLRILRMQDG